jgi:glucose-1-phosphate thymidylyltransferase
MKGIILAGGKGTRLHPLTLAVNKHLLPIYNKPLIYYPLSTLMMAGIREILLITSQEDIGNFARLLGNGKQWGVSIWYDVQPKPEGTAQALLIGREFIGSDRTALILGDNIFFGRGLERLREVDANFRQGALAFACPVDDPHRYGVVELSESGRAVSLEEKPQHPKSNYAVPGLYFYDRQAPEIAASLKPSKRGELEITDLNREYLRRGQLRVERLDFGVTWLDTGTPESLLEAGVLVSDMEWNGWKVGCPEAAARCKNFL